MPYKLTFAILVTVFGLTACRSQAQSAITATPSQIVIATFTQPFTQTAEPIDTPTHPPAPKPDETEEFPDCFGPYNSVRETSPDGQWVASVCERTNQDGSLDDTFPPIDLHIKKQDGSKEWKVSFKDITGVDFISYTNKYGEDAPFVSAPVPYHWYKDSRYLFIAAKAEIDGITPDSSGGFGLYRFDTQTGRVSPFLPPGDTYYDFAFSPDDEYYVYRNYIDKKYIHIASLESGEDQTIQLPGERGWTGDFMLSPDRTKFVFPYDNSITKKRSLLLFDMLQKTYTILLEIDGYKLYLHRWVSNTEVEFWKDPLEYLLNVETKELQPISTQPAP